MHACTDHMQVSTKDKVYHHSTRACSPADARQNMIFSFANHHVSYVRDILSQERVREECA